MMTKDHNNFINVVSFMLSGVLFFSVLFQTTLVSAQLPLTKYDVEQINKSQYYRDPEEPVLALNCQPANRSISSVYMIGDSITQGANFELKNSFEMAGASSVIDGLSSRTLSAGIAVLKASSDAYRDVDAIIIALGTNGGISSSNISDTIATIKEFNEQARIYWVNVGVDNRLRNGSNLPANSWNQTLQASAEELDYTVIDWATTVSKYYSNPIIKSDGLGVHPNTQGNKVFSALISTAAFVGGLGSGDCSTTLVGDTNPEKVWNYMIAKGLQPFMVAGFMGNMQAEAGFEPRRTEYAWSDPPNLSDTVPPCANEKCQPGYGIVQWTAKTRKDGLAAFAESKGVIAGDLGLQLDYVWEEINGACCGLKSAFRDKYGNVTVFEALLQTTTVEEATDLILRNYEIPADMDVAYRVRLRFANDWLNTFGSRGEI